MGEYFALKELADNYRGSVTPLVDVPPIPWDFENERPGRTIDAHVDAMPAQMADCWGTDAPVFVDLGFVDSEIRMADEAHPVDALFARLDGAGVQAIPVTATDRDDDYQAAIRTVVDRDGRGLCIRASADDIDVEDIFGALEDLADGAGVERASVDLVIDFRAIEASQVNLLRRLVVRAIDNLPNVEEYRTLTLLTGAFPTNLSAIPQGLSQIPRSDWALWLSVRSAVQSRLPSFGDYTAAHPDQEEIDPRIMQPSASIRYAADTDWVIARGRSVRSPRFGGYSQYNALSALLKKHPEFTGNSFSWASDYIDACAAGGPTGNLRTWRQVATNRHITRTAYQISNLP
ncbi:MAG: beta family protein [Methyloligella sp. ZOD6]